ncbi:MAG: hypothetical protein GY723_13960, partial [bacterium]|nr:hypothetical protein [bacterium]
MHSQFATRPGRSWLSAMLAVAVISGCASTGGNPDTALPEPVAVPSAEANPGSGATPNSPLPPVSAKPDDSPSAGKRTQSAMEGMLIGAIVGAQAGPIGAAALGAGLMLYGAITGEVPLSDGQSGGTRGGRYPRGSDAADAADRENEIERQFPRQGSLEDAVQAEVYRP